MRAVISLFVSLMHGDNLPIWCFSKCRECITLLEWAHSTWKDGARLSALLRPALPPPVSILNCKLWWMWTCRGERAPFFFSLSLSNEITWLTPSLMWKKWNPLTAGRINELLKCGELKMSQWVYGPCTRTALSLNSAHNLYLAALLAVTFHFIPCNDAKVATQCFWNGEQREKKWMSAQM